MDFITSWHAGVTTTNMTLQLAWTKKANRGNVGTFDMTPTTDCFLKDRLKHTSPLSHLNYASVFTIAYHIQRFNRMLLRTIWLLPTSAVPLSGPYIQYPPTKKWQLDALPITYYTKLLSQKIPRWCLVNLWLYIPARKDNTSSIKNENHTTKIAVTVIHKYTESAGCRKSTLSLLWSRTCLQTVFYSNLKLYTVIFKFFFESSDSMAELDGITLTVQVLWTTGF